MKLIATTALLLALVPASVAAQQPAAPAQPKITISKQALPAMIALEQAVNAKDTANLPARIAAAQAVAQTKEDRFAIGQLQLKAALAANDTPGMAAAIEAIAASQLIEPAKISGLYKDVGVRQFNGKQFDLSIASFQKASAAAPTDAEAVELLGQAMLAARRPSEALPVLQRVIQVRTSAGEKASEDIYRKALQAAIDSKSPQVNDVARQWLVAYPGPAAWRNTLALYRNSSNTDIEGSLALLRLMRAAGALTSASDYRAYAALVADQSNFNEAQAVLDEGVAAKLIDPAAADNGAIVAAIRGKPKASAADLAAAAKTAQSGMALLRIGDRLYGLGEYAKAVELYRQAQSKGVDANIVNLHIGMALARAGDKAGATAAFNAVTGQHAGVAKFWLLYLQQQG